MEYTKRSLRMARMQVNYVPKGKRKERVLFFEGHGETNNDALKALLRKYEVWFMKTEKRSMRLAPTIKTCECWETDYGDSILGKMISHPLFMDYCPSYVAFQTLDYIRPGTGEINWPLNHKEEVA